MTDTSTRFAVPSPAPRRIRTPSWLDLRLVFGVVLVLASVLVGASLLASADHRESRWSMTRDVAAGTVLTRSDLRPARVSLGAADSRYLPVTEAVVGRTVQHQLRSGELLPRAELGSAPRGVTVTIPLRPENAPAIQQGDRVMVWLSTKTCRGVVLLSAVPVQRADKVSGSALGSDIGELLIVQVSAADARRVVSALDLDGAVIRAGLLAAGQPGDRPVEDLSTCSGPVR